MNSEDLTPPLNEPVLDAPSTQPLLKELLADVREMKAMMATKDDIAKLTNAVERIEGELVKINVRLDGIENEQRLMRYGMETLNNNQLRQAERITMLEREFEPARKIAA